MSPTRYSPEQLDERARSLSWLGNDDNRTEASAEFYRGAASMLRQAASDARVLAQLRKWLEKRHAETERQGWFGHTALEDARVLAELDRLTRPAEEAEPS
jgi:hypothetical protein